MRKGKVRENVGERRDLSGEVYKSEIRGGGRGSRRMFRRE
jgi:hypothetical protein